MKNLLLSLLVAGVLAAPAASAQTTFRLGVRGGANRALTTTDPAGSYASPYFSRSTDKSALYAWQVGVVADIGFGKRLALQPALLFSQKGEHLDYVESSSGIAFTYTQVSLTGRYNWLELPLTLAYRLPYGLQLLAGPYVAVAVGGYQRGTSFSYLGPNVFTTPVSLDGPVRYGNNTNYRRFDAGLNFGLGYERGPVQVQLTYGLGLLDLRKPSGDFGYGYGAYQHDFMADAARNRVWQLTAAYFIELSRAAGGR